MPPSTMAFHRPFDAFPHLDGLLADFGAIADAARRLPSPNVEGDEFIRCGMVDFARHNSLDDWTVDHFHYVQTASDEVSDATSFSDAWRRFACLAAGYFLGSRVVGRIDDAALRLAEAHVPGFMFFHSPVLDAVDERNP